MPGRQFTVTLDDALFAELTQLAEDEERTKSALIRLALRRYLRDRKAAQQPAQAA